MTAANVVEILVKSTNQTAAGFTAARASAAEVSAATDEMAAADQRAAGAKAELDAKSAALAAAQEREGVTAGEVAAAEAEVAAAQEKATAAAVEAAGAADKVAAAQARQAAAAKSAGDTSAAAAAKTTTAAKESAGAQTAAGDAAVASGAKADTAGGLMAGMGSKVKLAGLGVAVGMGLAVKSAMDFQQSTTKWVTSAGESASQLGALQQGVLSLSSQTATSSEELSKGLYTVSSAGITGASGLNVLRAAAQGAKAEGADLGEVTNALTSGLNSYGMATKTQAQAQSSANSMMNQMVATVAAGKMSMQDLAGSLSAVLPVAAANKVSYAEVGGALSTMTSMGVSAQQGTQNLAFVIRSLANPTSVATNEMAAFGINSTDVASKLGQRGLTGTIQSLSDAVTSKMGGAGTVIVNAMNQSKAAAQDAQTMLGKLPASVQQVAKSYLDGSISAKTWTGDLKAMPPLQANLAKEWANVANQSHSFNNLLKSGSPAAQTYAAAMSKLLGGATGLSVGLMLTGQHAATFQKNVKSIGDAAKSTSGDVTGWNDITKETSFQTAKAGDSIKAAGTSLGLTLLPAVNAVLTPLASFLGMIAQNKAAAIAFAVVIGAVLAGAIGTKAVHALTSFKDAMKTAFDGVEGAVGKVKKLVTAQDGSAEASKKAGAAAKASAADQEKAWADSAAGAEKSAAKQEAAAGEAAAASKAAAGETAAANEAAAAESADKYEWMAAKAKPSFTATAVAAEESAGEVAAANEGAAAESSGSWVAAAGRQVAAGAAWVGQSVAKVAAVVASNVAGAASAAGAWVASGARQVASGIAWVAQSIAKVAVVVASNIAGALMTAAAWVAANAVMLLGIGLVVALVAIAVVEIVKHWSSIVAGVKKAWNAVFHAVSEAVSAVINFVKSHWQLIVEILTGTLLIALVKQHWSQIQHAILSVVDAVVNFVKQHWQLLLSIVTGTELILAVKDNWSKITSAVTSGADRVKSTVTGWWHDLTSIFSSLWGQVETRTSDGVSRVVAFFSGLPGRIVHALGDVGSLLFSSGEKVIQGLINGISNMVGSVGSAISNIAGEITSHLPFSPAKKGPLSGSGSPENSGKSIARLLASGISSGAPGVRRAMAGLAGSAASSSAGSLAIASGAGGGANAKVQFDFSGSSQDMFVKAVRNAVRVVGGGNVQKAFGTR